MTGTFILWAQALDNASPDHFEMRGCVLAPDDTAQRQEAVSLISSVVKKGSRVCEESSVILTADNLHFILEIPSAERDNAGRPAPIVCYGDYDSTGDAIGTSTAAALENFARRIGRTLQPEHLELVQKFLKALKKNLRPRDSYSSPEF
ncbi:hypothetical protein [Achromobacter aegrifaciens]|uniref:hypothetical protein n=1 Tax=Achromobacter aegrifaciens TaxID=1287736 RepID=UPI000F74B747|nr:hypothetical protein [Achromobacter aegrifaciens]